MAKKILSAFQLLNLMIFVADYAIIKVESQWTQWTPCPVTCGSGFISRQRLCDESDRDEDCVNGKQTESKECLIPRCTASKTLNNNNNNQIQLKISAGGDLIREKLIGGRNSSEKFETVEFGGHNAKTANRPFPASTINPGSPLIFIPELISETAEDLRQKSSASLETLKSSKNEKKVKAVNKVTGIVEWMPWGACSSTCGQGIRHRLERCSVESGNCIGEDGQAATETEFCYVSSNCDRTTLVFSPWSQWTSCSVTCGSGYKVRGRFCLRDNLIECNERRSQSMPCEVLVACPDDDIFEETTTPQSQSEGAGRKVSEAEGEDDKLTTTDPIPFIPPLPVQIRRRTWGEWTEWTQCASVSCENKKEETGGRRGRRTRARRCLLATNKEECEKDGSSAVQSTDCVSSEPCPSNSSGSSAATGRDARERQLTIFPNSISSANKSENGENFVDGALDVFGRSKAPKWTDWLPWADCSATCGRAAQQTRRRICAAYNGSRGQNQECDPNAGIEADIQRRSCRLDECSFNPEWTPWNEWSPCSLSCLPDTSEVSSFNTIARQSSFGFRQRARTCLPMPGAPCVVPLGTETERCTPEALCNELAAVVNELPWKEWGRCSVTCGLGQRTRFRHCPSGNCDLFSEPQIPHTKMSESEPCGTTVSCPPTATPEWYSWGAWSFCGVTTRVRTRIRVCSVRNECRFGSSIERQSCGNIVGVPGVSGRQFSASSSAERRSSAQNHRLNAQSFKFARSSTFNPESKIKNPQSQTSSSSKPPAKRKEPSSSTLAKSFPSAAESSRTLVENCVTPWGPWSSWSECSRTCGTGTRARSQFSVMRFIKCKGKVSEVPVQMEKCNFGPCDSDEPVIGWTDWGRWSQCSSDCGKGAQVRFRSCLRKDNNCPPGQIVDSRSCTERPCPPEAAALKQSLGGQIKESDESIPSWTAWGPCSVTCGRGTHSRFRTSCTAHGCSSRQMRDSRSCFAGPCLLHRDNGLSHQVVNVSSADDGAVVPSVWGLWSACSSICGAGSKVRTRPCVSLVESCEFPRVNETVDCIVAADCPPTAHDDSINEAGHSSSSKPEWLPWGPWSGCSSRCAGGTKSRSRECSAGHFGRCGEGMIQQTVRCTGQHPTCLKHPVHNRQKWASWSRWTPCSASCGPGFTIRHRICPLSDPSRCTPKQLKQTRTCVNRNECP